jgi:prefoldin subunit 5
MSEVDHVARVAVLETKVQYQDEAIERLNTSVDHLTAKIGELNNTLSNMSGFKAGAIFVAGGVGAAIATGVEVVLHFLERHNG